MRDRENTSTSAGPRAGNPAVWLAALAVFAVGLGSAVFHHWPALENYAVFKEDLVQSPHWAAYHEDGFRSDDLVLRYASFNESPVQNAIYWVGTLFLDVVPLSKILAVAGHGLLSLVFFLVGRALYGMRFGLLLALFITFLPDHWEYSAGFFSKFWMTPSLLLCVFLLQTRRTKGLVALLPFAALAYPVSAVLIGMTATVAWVQELFVDRARARTLFRDLAVGSVIAVALLAIKYVPPPDEFGAMRPGAELRAMPEVQSRGYPSRYIPIPPVNEALIEEVEHPFVLLSAVFYFLVLGRGVGWHRSWTALFLASVVGYLIADYFFLRLYVPDRYTRHSMALLLALWNARNWDLILARFDRGLVRYALVGGLLVVGGVLYGATYEENRGAADQSRVTWLSQYIREELPEGILIAGSPRRLDSVAIQAKRSILVPYKLAHPWFVDYYDDVRERTRATLRAHFADRVGPINELHHRYGATHFLVDKPLFVRARQGGMLFADPYSSEIYEELEGRRTFLLDRPSNRFIWEDERFALVELPIPDGL